MNCGEASPLTAKGLFTTGHGEQAEGEGEGCRQEQGEGEAAPHREHQVNQKTTQGWKI